jgi:hypothetical protein
VALYDRLMGLADPKLPVHQFMAALGEWERGKMTRAQVISAMTIQPTEEADLDTLANIVRTPLESYPLSGRVVLTNVGATYDANIDAQSLPFVWLQTAGVTRIDLEVRTRKVGTGTQDYQLWNETDGTIAIDSTVATTGSLSDAGAAADRTLTASRTFASPLAPGVKKLRLRAKSTVAADDPTFLNAAVLVFRVATITAEVLHQILLLAEYGSAPYTTVAAVKARLGVS